MKPVSPEKIWAFLILLTLGGAWLAESGQRSVWLTLVVAALIALKGRLVIDHYMEMRDANRAIRRVLHAFVTLVPLLVLASHGVGERLARLW